MAVGIRQIAQDLNLGVSTVAQALGGTGTISPRTRLLVQQHAAKLGYIPNRNAQRMRGAQTGVIGLIVPDVVLGPYVEVVQHLFQLVEEQGKELQISLTEFDRDLENRACKRLLSARVDGVIIKSGYPRWEDVPQSDYLRRIVAEKTPAVLYSGPIAGSGIPYIRHPNETAVGPVIDHFLALGHRRIGVLLPAARPFGGAMQTWLSAVAEALARAGHPADFEIIGLPTGTAGLEGPQGNYKDYVNQNHPQYSVPVGRYLFRQAMALPVRPTALLAYTDTVAVGAIYEAQAAGLKCGRDVAIAGCMQLPTSFLCPITLTTVDRRPRVHATKLLALLAAQAEGSGADHVPACDEVEPLLVIGDSTVGS